jgi:hypothetical protein
MEVSGQLHAPATLPVGNEPPIPIGGWVISRAGLEAVEKITNTCPCQESNPARLARRLVIILTELLISFSLETRINVTKICEVIFFHMILYLNLAKGLKLLRTVVV